MENNLKFEVIDLKDIWTEDEISNFWIDLYVAERDYKLRVEENKGKLISAIGGPTVTITISKENHYCNGKYKR